MEEPKDAADADAALAAKTKLWRYSLLVEDPQPVFDWLAGHVQPAVVRQRADDTLRGWSFRVAFNDPEAAKLFESQWSDCFFPKKEKT